MAYSHILNQDGTLKKYAQQIMHKKLYESTACILYLSVEDSAPFLLYPSVH